MEIRNEEREDIPKIAALIERAFADAPHHDGAEAKIVDELRSENALTISLVAEWHGAIIGYVAFSPVSIDGGSFIDRGWFGLGPVAVGPEWHRRGIGTALIEGGVRRLAELGAIGCVVLGEPNFYRRFGFENDPGLIFPGPPAEYFTRKTFQGISPSGTVRYHPAFYQDDAV